MPRVSMLCFPSMDVSRCKHGLVRFDGSFEFIDDGWVSESSALSRHSLTPGGMTGFDLTSALAEPISLHSMKGQSKRWSLSQDLKQSWSDPRIFKHEGRK